MSGAGTSVWPDIDSGDCLLRLLLVHRANGNADVLEEWLIRTVVAPGVENELFEQMPPNQWLLARLPCTRLVNTIRAVAADRRAYQLLALAPGEPLLVSERRAWSGPQAVTWVRLSFPGHRSEFVGEFNPLSSAETPGSN